MVPGRAADTGSFCKAARNTALRSSMAVKISTKSTSSKGLIVDLGTRSLKLLTNCSKVPDGAHRMYINAFQDDLDVAS